MSPRIVPVTIIIITTKIRNPITENATNKNLRLRSDELLTAYIYICMYLCCKY